MTLDNAFCLTLSRRAFALALRFIEIEADRHAVEQYFPGLPRLEGWLKLDPQCSHSRLFIFSVYAEK